MISRLSVFFCFICPAITALKASTVAGPETEKVYPGQAVFAASKSGYAAIWLNENEMLVQMVDFKGDLLFKTRIRK